jgi:hypothetical protein
MMSNAYVYVIRDLKIFKITKAELITGESHFENEQQALRILEQLKTSKDTQ